MKFSNLFLFKSAAWTLGAFGFGQALRLLTNIILARLLAPELFGIMVIVNSVRFGIELISDVGIAQNIVQSNNAERPDFYNTAWTLRLIRSFILWGICLMLTVPIAIYYRTPILSSVFPITTFSFVITALGSVSLSLLQKRLQYVRLNLFGVAQDLFATIAQVLLAYVFPNIWGLVFGTLAANISSSIGTYLVLPNIRHRFLLAKEYAREIFSFGKWIFLSSLAFFFAMNFDRLYFAKAETLGVVGVYGIARTLSELATAVVQRLCGTIVFPLIAQHQSTPRQQLKAELTRKRFTLLIIGALGVSVIASFGDLVIRMLYDQRYQAAGWMLPILAIGVWFSLVSNVNESTLLGFGKPFYGAMANGLKFVWLLFGLPFAFLHFGIFGGIIIVACSDLIRYFPIFGGLMRHGFAFLSQDLTATVLLIVLIGLFEWMRLQLGLGISFANLPIG